jgi:hypothetical protein
MSNQIKLNESELSEVVYRAVKKTLNEMNLFHRTRFEGKPQKIQDVFKGNGWKCKKISKGQNELVVRCFKDNDAILGTDDSLPFDELVQDFNIYFEDKKSPVRAYGDDREDGAFITFRW